MLRNKINLQHQLDTHEMSKKMTCTVYHVIVTIVWFNNVPFITESEYQFCKVYIYGLFTCCINRTDNIDGQLQLADACLLSQLVANWPHVNCQLIVPSKQQCLLGSKKVIIDKGISMTYVIITALISIA